MLSINFAELNGDRPQKNIVGFHMAAANHEKSLKKGETRKVVKTNETEKKDTKS